MAGFALSADEIASICRTLAAQTDGVPDQVTAIRSSEVGPSDLGGTRYADMYTLYNQVTQDTIPALLGEYASASRAMADRLARTLRSYRQADDDAAASMDTNLLDRQP